MSVGRPPASFRKNLSPSSANATLIEHLLGQIPGNTYGRKLIFAIQHNDEAAIVNLLDRRPGLINRPIYYSMNVLAGAHEKVWLTPLEAAVCERATLPIIQFLLDRGAKVPETIFDMCQQYDPLGGVGGNQGDVVVALFKRHKLTAQVQDKTPQPQTPPPRSKI